MEFTWLNKQGVRSDQGFEVQFTGRFDAEYRERGKKVSLYVEDGLMGGLPAILIDPTAFANWDDGEAISPKKQSQLFRDFEAALEFQGLKMLVQRGESPTGYVPR